MKAQWVCTALPVCSCLTDETQPDPFTCACETMGSTDNIQYDEVMCAYCGAELTKVSRP